MGGRVSNLIEFIPPTQSGVLRVRPVVGAIQLQARPLGWIPTGTSFTSERSVLTTAGATSACNAEFLAAEAAPSAPDNGREATGPVDLALPAKASDATAVDIAATIRPAPDSGGLLKVWPTGTPSTDARFVQSVSNGQPVEQLLVVKPGTGGKISVQASARLEWTLAVVGWSSTIAKVNQAVDDTTPVAVETVEVLKPACQRR